RHLASSPSTQAANTCHLEQARVPLRGMRAPSKDPEAARTTLLTQGILFKEFVPRIIGAKLMPRTALAEPRANCQLLIASFPASAPCHAVTGSSTQELSASPHGVETADNLEDAPSCFS